MRSQVSSNVVSLFLDAMDGRYEGLDSPNAGIIRFEFSLKDPENFLLVKNFQPIDVKFEDVATNRAPRQQRNITPGLVFSPEDHYDLWVKITAKPDVEGGNFGSAQDVKQLESKVRCDSDVIGLFTIPYGQNSKGCINPDALPIALHSPALYPYASYPTIRLNIRAAQAAGQPGAPDGAPIRRADENVQIANYNASCGSASRVSAEIGARPEPTPQVDEWQCDEYPFASSREGGGSARMMWVPRIENNNQGNLLKRFYLDNRVMLDDPYLATAP